MRMLVPRLLSLALGSVMVAGCADGQVGVPVGGAGSDAGSLSFADAHESDATAFADAGNPNERDASPPDAEDAGSVRRDAEVVTPPGPEQVPTILSDRDYPAVADECGPGHRYGGFVSCDVGRPTGGTYRASISEDEWSAFQRHVEGKVRHVERWRPHVIPLAGRDAPGSAAGDRGSHVVLPDVSADLEDTYLAAAGFVDVTDPRFGADPTGRSDSTQALNDAMRWARDRGMVTLIPPGEYLVSGPLKCIQAIGVTGSGPYTFKRETEYNCYVLGIGRDGRKPVIRLAEGTFPEYREGQLDFVFQIVGSEPNPIIKNGVVPEQPDEQEANPDLIHPVARNLKFVISPNNRGASGVRLQGAEGTGLFDIVVEFEPNPDGSTNGYIGMVGSSGSGGSHHNITIIGGRVGLDTRTKDLEGPGTQPTAVFSGFTFEGQEEYAAFVRARGGAVAVGWKVIKSSGPAFYTRWDWSGQTFNSAFALIDSTVEFTESGAHAVFEEHDEARSYVLENVFIKGASAIRGAGTELEPRSGWGHIARFAEAVPLKGNFREVGDGIFVDGSLRDGSILRVEGTDDSVPFDLQTRHQTGWAHNFWFRRDVANVKAFGAEGDGIADDTEAIQAAIDSGSDIVFVPRGHYRVTDTLQLGPTTKLVGVNKMLSVIFSRQSEDATFAGASRATRGDRAPLVQSATSSMADNIIAQVGLRTGYPIKNNNVDLDPENTALEVYALDWQAGGLSTVIDVDMHPHRHDYYSMGTRPDAGGTYNPFANPPRGAVILEQIVLIRGNGGGRFYNVYLHGGHALSRDARILRVEGTRRPLAFYMLHGQHQISDAAFEIREAERVTVYGAKTENFGAFLHVVDSRNIRLFGHGGIGTPDRGDSHYRFIDSEDWMLATPSQEVFNRDADFRQSWHTWNRYQYGSYDLLVEERGGADAFPAVTERHRPVMTLRGTPSFDGR